MKTRRFVDKVTIEVRAGRGGNGCCSFRREKYVPRGGPDGGDGGRGGHVILVGDPDTDSLLNLFFAPLQRAGDGGHGEGAKRHGANGGDLLVKVPCGTEVYDAGDGSLLVDILEPGRQCEIARGGKGGLGNVHWKSATHQAPLEHTPGENGEQRKIRLLLKIIADIGLVGFPNAGKSSLLRAISAAEPKVGAYPFTTLNPVVGTVVYPDYRQLRVADVPGLIEGAHQGVGLGHDFLRHIERSRVLAYVIDMAGVDGRKPWDDWLALRRELGLHRADLPERSAVVIANKMDLPQSEENLPEFTRLTGEKPLSVSALDGSGVEAVKDLFEPWARLPHA